MKVILAKNAGFCMGVRRAVDTTLDMVRKESGRIATFGPLIHNPQVLDLLEDRGVSILQEIPEEHHGTVIIRAHGVPPEKKKQLQHSGAKVKDATCPRVVKVQVIIGKFRKQGYDTVIIGDRNHAEVEGLMGHAGPRVQIVSSERDIESLNLPGPYIIVSQTTQDERSFEKLSKLVVEKFPQGKVFNTICDSTHKRQEEVRQLCHEVEAMVVVGGKTSANTTRLGEIAKSMGRPVFMVESESDLNLAEISRYNVVGVTAGASTPTWMINLVVRVLESFPTASDGVMKPFFFKLGWLILATNIYVSLAAAALTYICLNLLGLSFDWRLPALAAGYILAMHNLNRFTELRAKKISDPVKAYFFQRHRGILFFFSSLALLLSIALGYTLGLWPFALLLLMSVLGTLYSVHFIPRVLQPVFKIEKLQEIPGSKTLFVSTAWAIITVFFPVLAFSRAIIEPAVGLVFFFALSFAYIRCSLLDVFDMQGDSIVGRETLPVVLGMKKTIYILYGLLIAQLLFSVFLPYAGIMTAESILLLPGILLF
ncbi:MAG: 4-hydroxy-3-methylbut-2-enyl diphosphate reductase [Deltaproteobacteria bacterium]